MYNLTLFSLSFALSFFCLEKSGVFVAHALPAYEILLSYPVLAASLVAAFSVMAAGWRNRSRLKTDRWLATAGVVLVAIGLWTSWLTRFEGEIVLTEGQELEGRMDEFQQGHAWLGKLSKVPFVGLKLDKVTSVVSKDGGKAERVRVTFQVFRTEDRKEGRIEAGDLLPRYFHGMFIKVGEYGFSPLYSLRDGNGTELDSAYVYLNIFPSGREDYFRLLTPHTFYVRYYPPSLPDGKDARFKVRIVRNKDIVFNGTAALHEDIPVDNARIRFDEVRQWTKVTVVKDPGLLVIAAGGLLLCLGGALGVTRRGKRRGDSARASNQTGSA